MSHWETAQKHSVQPADSVGMLWIRGPMASVKSSTFRVSTGQCS